MGMLLYSNILRFIFFYGSYNFLKCSTPSALLYLSIFCTNLKQSHVDGNEEKGWDMAMVNPDQHRKQSGWKLVTRENRSHGKPIDNIRSDSASLVKSNKSEQKVKKRNNNHPSVSKSLGLSIDAEGIFEMDDIN